MSGRIFVSSVQKELAAERAAIRDFVQGDPLLSRFFSVFLFEDLPASDRLADAVYLAEIDRCELYVALFGNEYGFEDGKGVSPTEREFDRATGRGKPRLVFVKGVGDRARHPKMAALIRKAGSQLIRRRFGEVPELMAGLYASLVGHLERTGRLRTRPFDAAFCREAAMADLDGDKLDQFLQRARSERGYPLAPGTSMKATLTHLNLFDGGLPSHAAVLLFGREPQRFLLSSEVKCMHFHGREVRKPIPSYQVYRGTVFEAVDQAVDFVMSKVDRAVGTRASGPRAPVDYELPREAVAEAVVNAVAHRDYASNASVQVMLFADRLEVWNPGELPPSLTLSDLRRPHASIPRNPLIAEALFLAGYAEKAGTGILDMIAKCRETRLPAPQFRQTGGQFVQVLGRPRTGRRPTGHVAPQVPRKYPASTPQVVAVLQAAKQGDRSREELQSAAGIKDREHFRLEYLEPLLSTRLVERTLPEKPRSSRQRYRLTAEGRAWLGRNLRRGRP